MSIKTVRRLRDDSHRDTSRALSPLVIEDADGGESVDFKAQELTESTSPITTYTIAHSDLGEIRGEHEYDVYDQKVLFKDGLFKTEDENIKKELLSRGFSLLSWNTRDDK